MASTVPAERDLRRVIGDGEARSRRRGRGARRARAARALPLARPPAHLRRALGRLPPPGPDRHLRDLLGPRGDAGRRRSTRSTTSDWIFPSYRESAIGLLRGMPAATILSWWRGPPRRAGGTRPTTTSRRSASRSRRTCRTRPGSPGASSCAARPRCRDRVLRRRRDLRGRVPRGRELRGRDAGAARPPLQQQPAGRSRRRSSAQTARARRSPTRRSATGCPAMRVDGGDVLAVYEATREAVERARAGDGPTLHRGGHVPRGAARDRRRPERLHRPRAGRGGARRTSASAATSATSAGSGSSTTSWRRRSRPRRPMLMRAGIAAAEAEPPADVGARLRARARRSAARRSTHDLAELRRILAVS